MSQVRLLVGTRKGAFYSHRRWYPQKLGDIRPIFRRVGNIPHVKASPVDPNRIYASRPPAGSAS